MLPSNQLQEEYVYTENVNEYVEDHDQFYATIAEPLPKVSIYVAIIILSLHVTKSLKDMVSACKSLSYFG